MVDGIDMKQKWIIVLALVCLLTGCSGAFQIGDLTYDNFEGVVQEDGMYGRFEYAKYNDVTYYFYPEEYNEYTDFIVTLVDRYDLKYRKEVNEVPTKGRTEVKLTEENYVEEKGDWWDKVNKWFNGD